MKKSNFDLERVQSAEKLIADDSFTPCPINDDDELYPNGIFVFNITKLLEHIEKNPNEIDLVKVEVADFSRSFSSFASNRYGAYGHRDATAAHRLCGEL